MLQLAQTTATTSTVRYFTPTSMDREVTGFKVSDLPRGSQLALWSIRKWVQGQTKTSALETLQKAYQMAGIPGGFSQINEFMALLARISMRPVRVLRPCAKFMSADEVLLLGTLRSLQTENNAAASQRLGRIVPQSLRAVICRTAVAYTHQLKTAGLMISQITTLSVVATNDSQKQSQKNQLGKSKDTQRTGH